MTRAARLKRKPGRPEHADTAQVFSTTLPLSVRRLLNGLSKGLGRPKSEIITDAVRAYARQYPDIKPSLK